MKRGKPLKRNGALKRGSGSLRRDTEKAAEFLRKRGGRLKRERERKEPLPEDVRTLAFARSGGYCVMCLYENGVIPRGDRVHVPRRLLRAGLVRRAQDPHHVLPRRNFPMYWRAPDNIVGLCRAHHEQHEYPGVNGGRIPWRALPWDVQVFMLGISTHDGEAAAYLARTYPGAEPWPTGE